MNKYQSNEIKNKLNGSKSGPADCLCPSRRSCISSSCGLKQNDWSEFQWVLDWRNKYLLLNTCHHWQHTHIYIQYMSILWCSISYSGNTLIIQWSSVIWLLECGYSSSGCGETVSLHHAHLFSVDSHFTSFLNKQEVRQSCRKEGLKKQTWRMERRRRGGQLRSDIINYQQLFIPLINFSDESADRSGRLSFALLISAWCLQMSWICRETPNGSGSKIVGHRWTSWEVQDWAAR